MENNFNITLNLKTGNEISKMSFHYHKIKMIKKNTRPCSTDKEV